MAALRIALSVLLILLTVGAARKALRQSPRAVPVLFCQLLGFAVIIGGALFSIVQSSWQILGLGMTGGGILAGLGCPISMIEAGGALRKAALINLITNAPWWTGLIAALIYLEWGALGIGVFVSLVIHFLLQSWGREWLTEGPRAKTNADVRRRLAVLPDDEY